MPSKVQPLLLSAEPLTPSARSGQGSGSGGLGAGQARTTGARCLGPGQAHRPTLGHSDRLGPACLLTTREARQEEDWGLGSGERATQAAPAPGM